MPTVVHIPPVRVIVHTVTVITTNIRRKLNDKL